MSDSVRPHRWQPTGLCHPWDSPAKDTGVCWHFLLQCMKVKSESEVTQLCLTTSDPMDCSPPGSSIHGIFQARVLEWVAIAFSELYTRLLEYSSSLTSQWVYGDSHKNSSEWKNNTGLRALVKLSSLTNHVFFTLVIFIS